jgi:hypothetical protein
MTTEFSQTYEDFLKSYDFNDSEHNKFRYICYKNIPKIRTVNLPVNIQINLEYEAIFIEFRNLPHIEFLIRNTILKLGNQWSFTIICGNLNYSTIKEFCDSISPNIKIIKMEYDNININQYNNFFYDYNFWDLFVGKTLFMYQEDSIIFKNNFIDFINYDFIGAPYYMGSTRDIMIPYYSNGGFSIRNKELLIKILRNDISYVFHNGITWVHPNGETLDRMPEDTFFTGAMLRFNFIGVMKDINYANKVDAIRFSTDEIVDSNSFGGHQFWKNDKNWVKRMIKLIDNLSIS